MLRGLEERFAPLSSGFDRAAWRWLGAIALEQTLGRTFLGKLGSAHPEATPVALEAWLNEALTSGLLVPVQPSRALRFALPAAMREAGFSVHPDCEQLVLRELARRREIHELARETRSLLGAASVSDLTVALQDGDLGEFLRLYARTRAPTTPLRTASAWLRVSLCAPFDAAWLERTWHREAASVAARVLRESLDPPSPCDPLRAWASARLAEARDDEERHALAGALCQHAILRGEPDVANALVPLLPSPFAAGNRAAARFVEGDLHAAEQLLEAAFERKPAVAPAYGALAPLLGILLAGRETTAASAAAKRVFAAGTSDVERGAARAFRLLLRYLEEPEGRHRRIDVHHLEPGAGAWEVLLSALTVHLHLAQPPTRASWAQELVRRAVAWSADGYAWLGKQTLFLANELSADYCLEELSRQNLDAAALAYKPRELQLWERITPKPAWKKALQALARVSESITSRVDVTSRVAWYLDMRDGSFNLPALQEYRSDAGWSSGQRLSLAQLYEHRQVLPPEDARVLDASRETHPGRRELLPEAHEALIGHPRVFDGMRGQAAVEVVRGSCRVETEDDAGHIRVVVEPEGARLGINVVPQSESRLVVYRVTKDMHRVIEALPHGIRVPKAHEPEVLQVLAKLAQSVEVRSPHLGAERKVEANPTPCVRIAPHAGAWLVQVGVRPFGAQGRFFVAGTGPRSLMVYAEGRRLGCERDLELERGEVDRLLAQCPTLERDADADARVADMDDAWILGEAPVLALLAELRDAERTSSLEWPESAALNLRGIVSSRTLRGRLRSVKGWYLATGGVRLDDVTEIALRELVRASPLAGGRFLRLPDGDYVEVEERVRRIVAGLAAMTSRRNEPTLRIHPAAVTTLRELAEPGSGFEVDEAVAAWLTRVDELPSLAFPVPTSLCAELRPYQVEGYRWLCRLSELGLGACLADDMGLGKTLQIVAFLLTRSHAGPALVVAPTSVCANWALEMKRFAPSLTPLEYAGKDRAALLASLAKVNAGEGVGPGDGAGKVIICSYALLQQDEAELGAIAWETAVLDEAQFIKNAESLRARAAYRLSAKQRIASTGTPVENHFGDVWSIFQFLNPGLLGEWAQFRRRFVLPVERDGSAAPEASLRALIEPYVLRRLKRDVLTDLPPLIEVQHDVHLEGDDALRYAFLRKQIHDKLFTPHGKRQNKLQVLSEITRLRRFCCHPRLVFPDAGRESAKIRTFLDLASELSENKHRALVFSQYVDFLSLVREELDELSISYEYLDGSTPRAARQARIDAFQNGRSSLFLISLKAGGFGLNLTAADYVIHLDPWWNPAVEAQASDRAHRIGQDRAVTVYRLVTKDTIEEDIVKLHGKKQRLARALLDGGERAGEISAEELLSLIDGGAGG